MTEEQLRQAAEFYGITTTEARRRYETVTQQGDNPADPICIGCAKRPEETHYIFTMKYDGHEPTAAECREYVIRNEGTLNHDSGHYLCDPCYIKKCYIKNGMPSSDRGWVCP